MTQRVKLDNDELWALYNMSLAHLKTIEKHAPNNRQTDKYLRDGRNAIRTLQKHLKAV